jgi:Protein of unknown function (DUF2934)
MAKTPIRKEKASKKKTPASTTLAIQLAGPDEHQIRERAYGIWVEEGRPHGRDLAHWQRAHQELLLEAP